MKKIVVIGGGTGNFVVLSGLKQYNLDLSAIVSMADDGGSTGILRDELGVLPPGDVRQCLVALSDSSRLMRSLMNYRFENGGLGGHSFGNLLLSALEKVTGSFEKAVEEAGKLLSIKGKVIPVTTYPVTLQMILADGILLNGEKEVLLTKSSLVGFRNIYLTPYPTANPRAIDEIMNADLIVFGPGGLYTSLIPNLLVEGMTAALRETKAKKVFIVNLMNKKVQTPGFKTSDYLRQVSSFIGGDVFEFILVNTQLPPTALMDAYAQESEFVINDLSDQRVIAVDLLDQKGAEYSKSDPLAQTRAFIRHDPHKIASELMKIVNHL
ncbi:TPA: YvcK family protein [Candidatus Woesearchaeota archaeon]|nr:YvcK family protein [Candidatus Woesearchaeota archaeon]